MNRSTRIAAFAVFAAALASPVVAQTVKVTSLGSIDGEFCAQDRALVLEDPNGTRILSQTSASMRVVLGDHLALDDRAPPGPSSDRSSDHQDVCWLRRISPAFPARLRNR